MKSLVHSDRSAGLRTTSERQTWSALAQTSLTPFGTCCRVGICVWKTEERVGRALGIGEVVAWGGGGAEARRGGAVTGSPVRAADASGEEAVERGSADAGEGVDGADDTGTDCAGDPL